jgi:hypothetical protein
VSPRHVDERLTTGEAFWRRLQAPLVLSATTQSAQLKTRLMSEVTIVTPVGCIGNRGVDSKALEHAMERYRPHALAMDAGSMDCGPWYLGAGKEHSPSMNIDYDLETIIEAGLKAGIPIIIGSAGGSGAKRHVDITVRRIKRISSERGWHFKLAVVYSDVSNETLLARANGGEFIPGTKSLEDGTPLKTDAVKASSTIVGMMGVEPIIDALKTGADVVLCGRASDAAVIAAYPMWKGFDPALSYHMGDIMECGESAAEEIRPTLRGLTHNRIPIIGTMHKDDFVLRPALDSLACTPNSCLMHSFYERSDLRLARFPSGTLDRTKARYEAVDDNSTKISGAIFREDPYSVLLEGVKPVGFRSLFIFGVRTPTMIEQLDQILADIEGIEQRLFGESGDLRIHWHKFGKNAVLQNAEKESDPVEIGVIADVIASTQELAHDIAYDLLTRVSFWRYPGRHTTAGNTAMTFSPAVFDGGEVFEFNIYHAMETDYRDLCKQEFISI